MLSILEDDDGALWLGTNELGLLRLDSDREQAVWYESDSEDPDQLGGDLVVGLFRDHEGSFGLTLSAETSIVSSPYRRSGRTGTRQATRGA